MKPGRNRIAFSLHTGTLIIFSMVFSHFSYAQNDRITLNDGGTVYGKILNPEADAGMDYKIQIAGGGELLIPVRQVRRIVTPGQEMLTYQTTAPFVEDTVEAHLQIAKWCQNNSLSGWAAKHFEHILELDPDYEDAHKALGHVKVDGVWMSEQERYELSGLERLGGVLVTHQEALLAQEKEEAARAVSYWKKTIENLYNRMIHGDEEAINQLRNVKNPYALAPVTKRLQKEEDPSLRMVLVQAMGSIGTPAAIGDLGTVVLSDVNQDVRLTALDMIQKKIVALPDAIEYFRRILRSSDDNVQINRAGEALGYLEAKVAIPDLINALVTTHKEQIVTGSDQTGATFDSTGRMSGFSPGGGKKVVTVQNDVENQAVHDGLVKIVSRYYSVPVDFGFDVVSWRNWYLGQLHLENFNPRRDF